MQPLRTLPEVITTVQRCESCRTTWRGRHARWCPRCGDRLVGAAPERRPGPRWPHRRILAGGLVATLLAALVITVLDVAGDGRLLARPATAPGQGEVDLAASLADPDEDLPGAGAGPREPGSTGLSLADPPADAPWLTEDGEPWRGDLTLEQGPATGPSTDGTPRPVALDDAGWRIELGSASVAATGDGEVVVAGTRDGVMHAMDARTGEPRWATALGTAAAQVLLREGRVLVRHGGGQASVLDVATGELLWRRAPGLEEDRVLAVGGSGDVVLLVLGLPDRPRLLAVDARDGARRWERLLAEGWVAEPTGEVAPIGVVEGVLTGFEPDSGTPRWERELAADERVVELVGDLVLLQASDGYRWIDATSGEMAFLSGRLLGSWLSHPRDGLVLASAGGTSLLASADSSGAERWRTSLPRVGGRRECCIGLEATSSGEVLVTDRRGPEPIVRLLDQDDGEVTADLSALEQVVGRRVVTVTPTTAVVVGTAGTLGVDRALRTPRWRVPERTRLLSTDPVLLATERGGDGHGAATASLLAPP